MDDLRDRFASLDRVPVPDVWSDVERRLDGSRATPAIRVVGAGAVPRSVSDVPSRRWIIPSRQRPVWTLITVALIAAALVVGALGVGSGLLRLRAQFPPSPDASLVARPTSPPAPPPTTTEPPPPPPPAGPPRHNDGSDLAATVDAAAEPGVSIMVHNWEDGPLPRFRDAGRAHVRRARARGRRARRGRAGGPRV